MLLHEHGQIHTVTLHAPELVEGKQNIPFSRLSHKFHTSWPRTFACCETLNGFNNGEEGKVEWGKEEEVE